jgi:flagellar basal-body rod modification protein FlgD
VKLGYELPSAAASVHVNVYDGSGTLIKTLEVDPAKGEHSFTWDGKNDEGVNVPAGTYTFSVDARGEDGQSISATQYISGTVEGVRFRPEGTVFVIDGVEVSLSKILEIMKS